MSETGNNSAKLLEVLRLSKEVFLSDEKFLRELDAIIFKIEDGQTVYKDQLLGLADKMKRYVDISPVMNDEKLDDFMITMSLALELYKAAGVDWLEILKNKK